MIYFGNTSSLSSSDAALNIEEAFPNDCSRTEPETRPNVGRRNSDGNVKVLCNDENIVAGSGARDDSDLYLTKSLVCKPETSMSPSKGPLVNGIDRKSNEDIGGENNTFDENGTINSNEIVENGCENNSIDQNGILGEDNGELNGCENAEVEQNGIPTKDGGVIGSKNTEFDQAGTLAEESSDLDESMSSSTNTLVEDSDSSNTEVKTTSSEIENEHQVSESDSDKSQQTRVVSKAINCKSNHRLNHFNGETLSLHNGSGGSHAENHITEVGNSFKEIGDTPRSPKEVPFNKLWNYLDIDGLSLVVDPVQARLVKLERCYREKIEGLETQLQAHGCVCGVRQKVNIQQDMVSYFLEFIQSITV